MIGFRELAVSEELVTVLKQNGIAAPTAVQAEAIPLARTGRDIIAKAQTGTGKTLAFLLPIMDKIKPNVPKVQALIIAPTRELALQIAKVAGTVGAARDITSLVLYGGQDITRQLEKLARKPQIIIGTPGRLKDHIRRRTLDITSVNKVVIDEADEMLKLGFIEDVEDILSLVARDHQLLLFSATIPERIKRLANRFMKKPAMVDIKTDDVVIDTIKQIVITVKEEEKLDKLSAAVNSDAPYLAMVFCATKEKVHRLTMELANRGYTVEGLSGDLTQNQRNFVLRQFREAKIQLLCATDIAARGLDIAGVTHVYNYDLPPTVEDYIHRVGRTGRAGKIGQATTLVTPSQHDRLRRIETGIKAKLTKKDSPAKKLPKRSVEKDHGEQPKRLTKVKSPSQIARELKKKRALAKIKKQIARQKAKPKNKTVSNLTRRSRKK